MKITNTTAAIIAGGKSRRFGSPKYRAVFSGQPLIKWSLNLAQKLSDTILIISQNLDLTSTLKIPVFPDSLPGKGPLGGILTALEKMETEWLFVMPVDMPLLKVEIYQKLWQHKIDQRPVVAVSTKGIESMISLWHRSNIETIKAYIQMDRLKIHLVLKELRAIEVRFPTNYDLNFSNINFPEDLKRLEESA